MNDGQSEQFWDRSLTDGLTCKRGWPLLRLGVGITRNGYVSARSLVREDLSGPCDLRAPGIRRSGSSAGCTP